MGSMCTVWDLKNKKLFNLIRVYAVFRRKGRRRIMFKRVIWIILDSVGIGEAPDAKQFGDVGADTLGHIMKTRGYLRVPNM